MQDAEKINENLLMDTKQNLEKCISTIKSVYGDLSTPDGEQAIQMLEEINAII